MCCGPIGFGQESYLLVLEPLGDAKLSQSGMCFKSRVKQEGSEPKAPVPPPACLSHSGELNLQSQTSLFSWKILQSQMCSSPPTLPHSLFSLPSFFTDPNSADWL